MRSGEISQEQIPSFVFLTPHLSISTALLPLCVLSLSLSSPSPTRFSICLLFLCLPLPPPPSIPAGLIISLQLLRGDMEQVRRENPLIFSRGVAMTRKLGFPDVIMPGESRHTDQKDVQHNLRFCFWFFFRGTRVNRNVMQELLNPLMFVCIHLDLSFDSVWTGRVHITCPCTTRGL